MTIIIIAIILFVVMLTLPILFSLITLRRTEGEVLYIDLDRVKDPRYFVKSFVDKFDKGWEKRQNDGEIILSRKDSMIQADKQQKWPNRVSSIVFAETKDFNPKQGTRFDKEVYVKKNATLNGIKFVRAIAVKGDLKISQGTKVLRWADAEGELVAEENCDLGISATSLNKVVVGINTKFTRIYAPTIVFGKDGKPKTSVKLIDKYRVAKDIIRDLVYVDDDNTTNKVLDKSIVTIHALTVLGSYTVNGDIRSYESVTIEDGAIVNGNIFAEGDVIIGKGAVVCGSVFSQEDIIVEKNVVLGQPGKSKSVVARGNIVIDEGSVAFGYVGSEKGGWAGEYHMYRAKIDAEEEAEQEKKAKKKKAE